MDKAIISNIFDSRTINIFELNKKLPDLPQRLHLYILNLAI